MLLADALVVAEARTNLAALADTATSIDASSAYEQVLIALDRLHADQSPAIDTTPGTVGDRDSLFSTTVSALESLTAHGLDPLEVELLLARLTEARAIEAD